MLSLPWRPTRAAAWLLVLLPCLLALAACQTAPGPGPANLAEPGWTVRQGQAVWQRSREGPEIAGEILLATQATGRTLVQLSKNGFPLVIAQSWADRWEVELPAQNRRYAGRGLPPKRLLILYLPRAIAGQSLPSGWSWNAIADGSWRLTNHRAGESLEGYFNQ